MTAPAPMRDPFGLTADPQGYVPREATETALAALITTLGEGRRPAALVGPPGLGKTLLLHLVAQRLDDRLRPIYLPYAALPLDELCGWALSLLGFSQSDDTIGDLIQTATQLHAHDSGLLLLVDDASAMPLPTARKLGDLVAASRGALRLLVAAAEGPSASRMLAATGANVHVVRLLAPMTEAETRRYIAARLSRAGIPLSMAARFDDAAIESIQRLSAGIPRRVHGVASAVLRGAAPESAAEIFKAEEEAEAAAELAAAQSREAPPEPVAAQSAAPLIAREEEAEDQEQIEPDFDSQREGVAARPYTRVEAAPSVGVVFATALACGALFVAVPWLRATLAPAAPSVASQRPVERSSKPPPAPVEAPVPARPIAAAVPPEPSIAPAAAMLSVQVNARPWANIEVNGVDLGPTPIAGIPLLAGKHQFRARMPDGRVVEREVEISPENRFIVFE